ncbi:MAG TPA: choice-of-anchor D domain-containing protein [Terriglobia bacterium]|nr:choice-of-anchor D domain-containing protein [Terriglobia bacterium]
MAGRPPGANLTGEGGATGPVATLSPTALTFASQAVGTASPVQTIALSNTGNEVLTITHMSITGANPGDFIQRNNCAGSVAAGAQCIISLVFKPTASGKRSAAVSVTDNAPGHIQSASLSGTGAPGGPIVILSPLSLTFANQPVDMTSSSEVVTLSNTGSATLSIAGISLAGANARDFTQVNTCHSSLAAGGKCTIAVLFTPSIAAIETASLMISDNAAGSPQSLRLSGKGTHDVILTWTASSTPAIEGYNVYRGNASHQESTIPLNSFPITQTTYVDAAVQPGHTYYYVVTTVGSGGTAESADSNEAAATVPAN